MADFDIFDRELYNNIKKISKRFCEQCGMELDWFWYECPFCKKDVLDELFGEDGMIRSIE